MTNHVKTNSIIGQYGYYLYLVMLSMLSFVATDMYLPAFKSIESSLGVSASEVAMSLTTFLAGLAIGQLLYGDIVRKYGKRLALMFGLGLFMMSTLAISMLDSMLLINICRVFQALGVCSASVIWQALVIEKHSPIESQKMLSNLMPLVALSPAIAPILGALVLEAWGWRSIFVCLAVTAIILMVMTVYFVDKDRPNKLAINTSTNQQATNTQTSFTTMLVNRFYLGNVLIFSACSASFFSYLTLWPIVMDKFGYDAGAIAWSFVPQTVMFIVGGYSGKLLISKWGSETALKIELGLFFTTSLLLGLFTLVFEMTSIYPVLVVFALQAAANGAIYPITVNQALQTFKGNATKAAGLQNFIQVSCAFFASSLMATFALYGEVAMGWGIIGSSCLVVVAIYWRMTGKGLAKACQNKHDMVENSAKCA
ncbi:Bcr/CflA family multidrug efflux MFS transporter [Shewanella sp. WXL01]|nr:Bcr/CflA family multidrug efflux MFS transporter [Shewanella sp. WXL01]